MGAAEAAMASDDEEVVEFAPSEEENEPKPLSGRRLKAFKEHKRRNKPGTFESMGFNAWLLKAIRRKGYRLPTPIQRKAMPHILQGQDVIGMARTGSGKTAAFVLPMLQRLQEHSPRAGARALILAPTRELTLQTHKVVRELSRGSDLRTAVLVGGDSMEAQFAELAQNPDILVATPGRLLHHLAEVEGMSLGAVEYCVADEADRLFEMGFQEQVADILSRLHDPRQLLLFSATLPRSLADFASGRLQQPVLVRLDAERRISPDLALAFLTVQAPDKLAALVWLLREVVPAGQSSLVFASTRHHVDFLAAVLAAEGLDAAFVHGSMDQAARKIQVAKFRAGRVKLLVTTDVAARGIDIPLIDNVVNFDFPPKPELFVHRVGRAARAGRTGSALSLVTRDELPYLLDLHLFLGRGVGPAPQQPPDEPAGALDPMADSLYGGFPPVVLEPLTEHLQQLVESKPDLEGAQRSLMNAFGLYLRTRPAASSESVARAKALPPAGVHPLLAASVPATRFTRDAQLEAKRVEFTQLLKSFRPAATVLEQEIAKVRSSYAGTTKQTEMEAARVVKSNDVMSRKRAAHAHIIDDRRTTAKRARPAPAAAAAAAGASSDDVHTGGESSEGGASDEEGEGDETARARRSSDGGVAAKSAAVKAQRRGDGVLSEGRFRDEGFYLSHTREERPVGQGGSTFESDQAELQAAVLDMMGEDQDAMRQQQRQWRWDNRKKRYIMRGADEGKPSSASAGGGGAAKGGAARRVRTESGALVEVGGGGGRGGRGGGAPRGGLYQKWVVQNKQRVSAVGELEGSGASASAAQLANRFHPSQRHRSWKLAAGGGPAGSGATRGGLGGGRGRGRGGGRGGGGGGGRGRGGGRGGGVGRGGGGGDGGVAKRGGELKSREQVLKERRKKSQLQQGMRDRQHSNAARAKRNAKGRGGGRK